MHDRSRNAVGPMTIYSILYPEMNSSIDEKLHKKF